MKTNRSYPAGPLGPLAGLLVVILTGLAMPSNGGEAVVFLATDEPPAPECGAPALVPRAEPVAQAPPLPTDSPLTQLLLDGSPTMRVADAVARLGEVDPSILPVAVPVAAAQGDASPLNRPVYSLTLDGAADPQVTRQMANLSEEFAINDLSLGRFGDWNAPQYEAASAPARFGYRTAAWAAPAVYSRPLYFEQPNLERYGHHVAVGEKDCLTQSALSAAHFFATVPVLPYKMGVEHPDECSYVLGSYRPGSCNPHQLQRPQWSLRGLAYEGLAVTGLVFLIP